MPTNTTTRAITHLLRERAAIDDDELLGDFVERRDEAALGTIICRHGPMVWGVCRRLLSHHDAEDAFQAAFLVLVRKAASVTPRAMLGNWLYGVAHRTAQHAARTTARRRAREITVNTMPDRPSTQPDPEADAQPLFDEELSRLPEIYRAVVVLCELEGRTRKEVAAQLRVPEGTVAGRLARAKSMLAKRLAKRGVHLSSAALASTVPASLMNSTIQAATLVASAQTLVAIGIAPEVAHLAEGVLKAMFLNKLKILTVLAVTLCVLGTGAGVLRHHTLAMGPQVVSQAPAPKAEVKAPVPKAKPKEDKELLQGTWHIVEAEAGGKHQANETSKDQIWVFTGDKLAINYADGSSREMTYQLDPKQKPKAIDLSPTDEREKGSTFKGIYELDGDRLKLYYSRNVAADAKRPARFDPEDEDRGRRSFVLKRAPGVGDKLPKGVEAQLKWGEPVDGLRAALAIRPIPGARKPGDLPDLFLVVQNVSKGPLRFCNVTEVPEVGTIYLRGDGMIKWSGNFNWPTRVDVTLQPGEVAFQPLFPLNPKDGVRLGSGIADDVVKLPRYSLVAKMQVEKAPAGAWTGKLVTGETSGAAAEIKAEPPAAPEKKAPPKEVPEKAAPATPVEVFPTQMEMRRAVTLKTFMVAFRKHHGDKNANALREFIDPRYLKQHGLTDRDLVIPMPAVGNLRERELPSRVA